MAAIIRHYEHGTWPKRVEHIHPNTAEALVEEGKAVRLQRGLYEQKVMQPSAKAVLPEKKVEPEPEQKAEQTYQTRDLVAERDTQEQKPKTVSRSRTPRRRPSTQSK